MLDGMTETDGFGARAAAPVDLDRFFQKTVKNAIHCTGVGLHSGAPISMTLRPAEAGTGLIFRRTDGAAAGVEIPARFDAVCDTRMCTVLGNGDGVTIGTVEHLMAALAGCEIDNAIVELDGPEVPIMDGSSEPFVFLVECAGIAVQDAPRRALKLTRPVSVTDGAAEARLVPGDDFTVALGIEFDNEVIGRQELFLTVSAEAFRKDIARARTFGFLHEVEALRKMGLARGGSLDNAVVVSGDRVMNEEGLRFEDEFVRHKVLDCIGDLYLAGGPILAHYRGRRPGHALNNKLLRAVFADPANYEWVTLDGALDTAFDAPRRALAG